VPWSDCSVALLGDDELVAHAERHLTARIVAIDRPTHDIVALRFETLAGGPMTFSAGQYATIEFAGLPPRDFSMANAPGDPTLEFHLRVLPGGRVSGYAATQATVGETVRVRGPYGGAFLRERHAGPAILGGGGTGLAPMLSILETLLARDPERRVELYVAARDERDLYAGERIAAIAAAHPSLAVHRVLSAPTGAHPHRTGFLADAIAADFDDVAGWKAYLAGPPVMVETVTAALEAKGMARRDIHADAFLPAPVEVLS
jgi:CDP-4-dehydro-6-deoxyglucose reductase/ferredoxin-NAD(P)+ reductase (naphthalene dioxygenase ferredoxin-specific)